MILIGQYDSPYVRRVAVSLHVLALPFKRNPLSVFADADAMRSINPLGRVPSLVLASGEALIDSAAILDHLDQLVGDHSALIPRHGAPRRSVLGLVALATGAIDKAGAIAYEQLLRPADRVHQPWLERNRVQLFTTLAALEAATPERGWFGGPAQNQADISSACMLAYVRFRSPQIGPLPSLPKLQRLSFAAEALPAFKACRPTREEIGGSLEDAQADLARFLGDH
jgi:glutathione S-transferase